MPLKLVRRGRFWHMHGTVRGISVRQTTGAEDEASAETVRIAHEAKLLRRSVFGESVDRFLGEAALSYLETAGLKPRDEAYIHRLVEHWGEGKRLTDIGNDAISAAARALVPSGNAATANRTVINPAAALLHHAAALGWVAHRPIPRRKEGQGRIRWLTPAEADALVAACSPHMAPLVAFLFHTGARLGEALTLDWRNVDLPRRQVSFTRTKTGKARGVPLNDVALAALANIRHRTGHVFRTNDGKPYPRGTTGSPIKTGFRAACRRAGIRDFTPHDCRHTWATWFYAATRDLRALMELGGWSTLRMVERYTHVNTDHLLPALQRVASSAQIRYSVDKVRWKKKAKSKR